MNVFNNINNFVFLIFLGIRLLSVFIIQTSFVPDEYWQSLEVAHKLTFGYGYLTWEWEKKIRGSVYPIIFSIFYSVFPDSKMSLIYLPRIVQALLSTTGDFFTYKLASKLFGYQSGQWTVFNLCSSWFLFYCCSRTLTNMAETSFTSCGLYFYPWKTERSKGLSCKYLWFAGASILMRPTGAVLWIALYIYHAWRERYFFHLFKITFIIGSVMFGLLMLCDRWCYGQWVISLYNFFYFNWSKDIGVFYGSHNFFWYLTVGLPVVLTTFTIPFILGLTVKKLRPFYVLVLWFLLIFSIPSHKEFRFLLPILPICLIIASVVMEETSKGKLKIFGMKINKQLNTFIILVTILVNVPLCIYMGLFHQRGAIDVVLHLSRIINDESKVLFLMPCHSTPYYSYIHRNISMKFLTCEPNFDDSDNYLEEADEFYQNPMQWLSLQYNASKDQNSIPTHIVMFDTLDEQILTFFEQYKYYLCYRTFHSHVIESRRGKYILIYCKT